ncbi:MAG: hypothetical protein PVI26_01840 [Chitinispirillia bacterium]
MQINLFHSTGLLHRHCEMIVFIKALALSAAALPLETNLKISSASASARKNNRSFQWID